MVHHHTGGLETTQITPLTTRRVHHHTGGLEKVKYYRLPYSERAALLNRLSEISSAEGEDLSKVLAFSRYQDEMLDKVFAGWEKGQITDENGEVEPDAAGIAKVLQITEFRKAVIDGYQASQGGEKVKAGN